MTSKDIKPTDTEDENNIMNTLEFQKLNIIQKNSSKESTSSPNSLANEIKTSLNNNNEFVSCEHFLFGKTTNENQNKISSLKFNNKYKSTSNLLSIPTKTNSYAKKQRTQSIPATLKSETISTFPNESRKKTDLCLETPFLEKEVKQPEEQIIKYTIFNYKLIITCIAFIAAMGPLAGSIYIPAIPLLEKNLKLSRETMDGSISLFMAVFCVFPLVWGVLCDRFGRKIILLFGLILSLLANALLTRLGQLCAKNILAQLYYYRVIQGIAASCFISCGCAMIRDLVSVNQRATYMGYFFLGPNIAPVIAPIIAGIILSSGNDGNDNGDIHWRWLFLILVILNCIGLGITIIILPETCRSLVGNGDPIWAIGMKKLNTLTPEETKLFFRTRMKIHLGGISKPISENSKFLELYEKPPTITLRNYIKVLKMKYILLVSVSVGLQFSLYYAFVVTLSHELKDNYGFKNMGMAAGYVVPGSGLIIGTLSSGRISDKFMKKCIREDKLIYPEKRLIFQLIGIYTSCIGGIMYGWFLQFHVSVVAVFISSFFIGIGLTWATNSSTTYASLIAKAQTGTAVSIMNAIRNAGAAISSGIAYTLINKMGCGWFFTGLSLLVAISTSSVLYVMNQSYKKCLTKELERAHIDTKLSDNISVSTINLNNNDKKEEQKSINIKYNKLKTMSLRNQSQTSSITPSNDKLV